MKINLELLNEMVQLGYVSVQTHPVLPLRIFKYRPTAQFEKMWNEVTTKCRGLVLDNENNVINNCIEKFHNIEELESLGITIPDLPYEITDKVDGSAILIFWYKNHLIACTLGSFVSDQAKLAQELLNTMYSTLLGNFEIGKTYVMEILAPENKIVLDHGTERRLVLITIRDNETGEDSGPVVSLGFPIVEKIDKTIEQILIDKKREDFINKEGFVVKFSNGFRVKVKYEEYFRLHKIMTGINEKFIWEFMKDDKPLPLENVPDEFFNFITQTRDEFIKQYRITEDTAMMLFKQIPLGITRKEFAFEALKQPKYSSIMFKMLEDKDYSQLVWKMIEPKSTETQKFNSFRA